MGLFDIFSSNQELTQCSFCGKTHAEVRKLVAGPGVFICDACIQTCARVLADASTTNAEDTVNETKKSDRNEIIAHALEQRMQTVYGLADRVATLSTGVLAFTITFAKNSVSPAASHQPLSLKLSWFGFMLSVVGFFIIHVGKSSLEARALAAVRSGVSGAITVVPPWYFHFGRWLVTVGFLGGLLCLTIYGFYYA